MFFRTNWFPCFLPHTFQARPARIVDPARSAIWPPARHVVWTAILLGGSILSCFTVFVCHQTNRCSLHWSCALLFALHQVNPEFSSPIKVSLPKSVTKAGSRHRRCSLWESGVSGARRLSPGSTFARPCKRGSVSIYKGPSSGFHFLSSLLPFLFDLNWQVAFGVPSGASLWNSHYLDIVSSYVVYILTSCLFDQIMNPNVQFTIFHSCRIDSVSSRMPAACWCSHLCFFLKKIA